MDLLVAGAAVVAAGALGPALVHGVAAGAAVVTAGTGEDRLLPHIWLIATLGVLGPIGYFGPFSAACLVLVGLVGGCTSDSPTRPKQEPSTPPGTAPPTANWNITVTANPSTIEVLSIEDDSALITVTVRNASDSSLPPDGTFPERPRLSERHRHGPELVPDL